MRFFFLKKIYGCSLVYGDWGGWVEGGVSDIIKLDVDS